jgi:type II secretion system protein G
MNFPKLRNSKGFTLVELIIVIMIIGILSATILPKIMGAPARARDTGRVKDLDSVSIALNQYYDDNKQFPPATDECLTATSVTGAKLVSGGYMLASNFPMDPTATAGVGTCSGLGTYYYSSLPKNGIVDNSFILGADVENDGEANANVACSVKATYGTVELVDGCIVATAIGTAENAIFLKLGGL